jgi:spermidine/putrescine transport system substrate-binding protein
VKDRRPITTESPAERFTRRELLRRGSLATASLLAMPSLLAACGGGGEEQPDAGGVAGGTIDFYSWQGYDLSPDVKHMQRWLEENGVTLNPTYVSTHNDITAKFTTGGGKGVYDLSTFMGSYGPWYVDLGIPSPLDVSKIPNFGAVYPIFRPGGAVGDWFHFDGKQWGIPFTWGIQGVNYDASKIDPPASYRDLLDPSLRGKIAVTDDIVAGIVIGAHVLGIFRPDSLYGPEELDEIIGFWKTLKAHARTIVPSFGNMADLFVAGEIVAATPGWAAVNSFAADKGYDSVQHTVPEEGAATFCDGYMIPDGAREVDAAYAFINEALSPEAQAEEAAFLVQAVVHPEAVELLDPATRELYPYDQIDEVLTRSAPLEAIPAEVPEGYANFDDWNKAWEDFKAS